MDVLCAKDDREPKVTQSDSEVLQTSMKLEEPRSIEELTEIKGYLNEPMLCREATDTSVPNRLVEIFKNECSSSQPEALCAVLHVLMLETGFSPNRSSKCHSGYCMPDSWRCPGSYKLTYSYPASEASSCNLLLVPLGSQMMVHGNITGGEPQPPCKIQLKVQDYIGSLDQDVPKVYSNLAKLSRVFKDTISLPLLHKIHSAGGSSVHQGFMSLPNELKLVILKHLDVGSLLKVAAVSKSLNKLAKDPWLWRRHYLLYWPKRSDNSLNQDWYEVYRVEYKQRKDLRERLKRMTPVLHHHPFFPRIHPMSDFIPPPPTFVGIIGGEYDLNPNFGFPDPVFPGTGRLITPERHPQLLQPRFDPMGSDPDMNMCIPTNRPRSPQHGGRYGGGRPFFGGMNPRFL
ncbi:F-box only protein 7-like isoform X2 [Liolophura sinensis]